MDENILVAFIQAITLLFTAIAAYLASKNRGKITAIGAKVDVIDNAQTAQMVAQGNAAPVQQTRPYYRMTDAAKSFETEGWSPEQKEAFLSQVAFNEAAGNVRYPVTIPGRGTAVVENGCVVDTNIIEK